ncbi:MAG: hypothetical protein JNL74_20235 [Fibrobacteres bacterium]|nr:hypothetical protein [Fibrobacterota bacterium]
MTRPIDLVVKFSPLIMLTIVAAATLHPALVQMREAALSGWFLAALLFYPAILIQKQASDKGYKLSLFIPLAMTIIRMMAIMVSLLFLTKYMKHWLIPFSVGLLSSFPVWILFEMRSMKLQLAAKRIV